MKNKCWEKNLSSMEKYHKELQEIIEEELKELSVQREEITIETEFSYTNELITTVTTVNGKYYLAGKYLPDGMAQRMMQKYQNVAYGSVILSMGLSDGRLLNKLAETVNTGVTFVIYEPSLKLFLHTLHHYDCTKLLERKEIIWAIGETANEFLEKIFAASITVDNMLKVIPIVQGNYDKIFKKQIKNAITALNKCIRKLRVDWNTWIKFSGNTVENTIKNGKYVYQHYSMDALFGMLPKDVAAIVVAAGPSLDKNIERLKNAKGKACILACDTALKPLLNHGIIPDFFFIVDPSKPFELFDDARVWQIPMVTGMNIPAKIMETHTGKKILCKDNSFMLEMFKEVFGEHVNDKEHAMNDLPTGGSVATSAFSAARLMGAKTILLIGQDLALTGENEHAAGTFKKDRKLSEMAAEDLEIVQDIYGREVKTTKDFKYYLDWYEDEIAKYPDLHVVDASEGGAFIPGTEIMTLQEALDTYCSSSFDAEAFMESIPTHFNAKEQQKALTFMQQLPNRFEKIKQQIREGKKLYRRLADCAKKNALNRKEIDKVLKKIKKINLSMEKEILAEMLLDGIKQEEYIIRTNAYDFQKDEQKNLLESAQMGIRFMESMEDTLEKMWPDIEALGHFDGTYS